MIAEKKMPVFAERFGQLRQERNMTQAEYADFLGISRPTVGFYENGDRVPDAIILKKIAERCKVTADYLLGLTDVATMDTDIKVICDTTGLSEEAVTHIEQNKNDFFFMKALEILIKEKQLLSNIASYLYGFIIESLPESDFSDVPLTIEYGDSFSKIAFADVIERLPHLRDVVEKDTRNHTDEIRKLYLEFLCIYGDYYRAMDTDRYDEALKVTRARTDELMKRYAELYPEQANEYKNSLNSYIDNLSFSTEDINYTFPVTAKDIAFSEYIRFAERKMGKLEEDVFYNSLPDGQGGAAHADDPETR